MAVSGINPNCIYSLPDDTISEIFLRTDPIDLKILGICTKKFNAIANTEQVYRANLAYHKFVTFDSKMTLNQIKSNLSKLNRHLFSALNPPSFSSAADTVVGKMQAFAYKAIKKLANKEIFDQDQKFQRSDLQEKGVVEKLDEFIKLHCATQKEADAFIHSHNFGNVHPEMFHHIMAARRISFNNLCIRIEATDFKSIQSEIELKIPYIKVLVNRLKSIDDFTTFFGVKIEQCPSVFFNYFPNHNAFKALLVESVFGLFIERYIKLFDVNDKMRINHVFCIVFTCLIKLTLLNCLYPYFEKNGITFETLFLAGEISQKDFQDGTTKLLAYADKEIAFLKEKKIFSL